MQIRTAKKYDTEQIKAMWQYSFGDGDPFLSWNFEENYNPNDTIVIEYEGRIGANLQMIPYNIRIGNGIVQTSYISGATTLPEMRNKGLMKLLIAEAFERMKDRGDKIAMLVPFSYKFYQKYGFATCYDFKQYDITPNDIPSYKSAHDFECGRMENSILSVLNDIYTSFTADKNGYIIRTLDNWRRILDDLKNNFGGNFYIVYEDSIPVGYVLYIIKGRKMSVFEMAYTKRSVYESIMNFIRSHSPQIDSVSIKASSKDMSFLDFCDKRDATRVYPFAMARLIDIEGVLSGFAEKTKERVSIMVIDSFLEQNSGVYTFDGQVVIKNDDAVVDVTMDIATLTQLAMGYITVYDAYKLGKIFGDYKKLAGIFGYYDNFINMLFN